MKLNFTPEIFKKIQGLLVQKERSYRFVENAFLNDCDMVNNALQPFTKKIQLQETGLVIEFDNLNKKLENDETNVLLLMLLKFAINDDQTILSTYTAQNFHNIVLTKGSIARSLFNDHTDIKKIEEVISKIKLSDTYIQK